MASRRWLILCLLSTAQAFSQMGVNPPAFEIATITPVAPNAVVTFTGIMGSPDGIEARNVSLSLLIRTAYDNHILRLDDQVVGAPEWSKTQRYNIHAKFAEADSIKLKTLSIEDRRQLVDSMLQSLLADRFALQSHPSTTQAPVFELVIADGGFKLKQASDNDPAWIKSMDGKANHGPISRFMRNGTADFQEYSMDRFADTLTAQSAELGRPVVNKTDIPGVYNFSLNWAPGPRPDGSPGLSTALKELGLRLKPAVVAEPVLIIDHVEKPTPN